MICLFKDFPFQTPPFMRLTYHFISLVLMIYLLRKKDSIKEQIMLQSIGKTKIGGVTFIGGSKIL